MESVRTEIRLSAARILARFGQTDVQRRFPRLRAATLQLGRDFGRSCPPDGPNASGFERSHQGGSEDANRGTGQEIIRAVASFRSTSALDRAMHVANGHRALRLAPLPASAAHWGSAGLRRWRRAVAPAPWRGALICPRASLRDPSGCVLRARPARKRRLAISPSERIPSRRALPERSCRELGSRPRARGLARRDARRFDHSSMSQTASLA